MSLTSYSYPAPTNPMPVNATASQIAGLANAAAPMSPTEAALQQLSESIGRHCSMLNELENRLSNALRPSFPTAETGGVGGGIPEPARSNQVAMIHELIRRADINSAMLADIIARVDV